MKTKKITTASNISQQDLNPDFLVILIGGAGKASGQSVLKQHEAAGDPFAMFMMAIDTDPIDFDDFDFAINIAPTHSAVSAMAANPSNYGPACRAIIQRHPNLLNSEALGHGARMSRIITQAAFELYEEQIGKGLRNAIHSLLRRGRSRRIQPVVALSLGGGTGSAGAVLLLDFFMDELKKSQITLGLRSDLIAHPVLFCVDAYAHAIHQSNDVAPNWILCNIYATRVELAEYEKAGRGYQYTFHLGLGNAGGAVFSTIDQVCEANGVICWEWMANYAYFKSHAVNNLDFYIDACRYRGKDTPEHNYPEDQNPEYGEHIDNREIADEKDEKDNRDTIKE